MKITVICYIGAKRKHQNGIGDFQLQKSVVSPFRFVPHNHAAFKLCSLWHVGSLLDDFCDSDVARGPPTGSRVWSNDWFSFPALPVVPLSFSCYRLDAFTYLAYSVLTETKYEPRCSSKFLAVRPSDARSPKEVEAACDLAFVLLRRVCCSFLCRTAGRARQRSC